MGVLSEWFWIYYAGKKKKKQEDAMTALPSYYQSVVELGSPFLMQLWQNPFFFVLFCFILVKEYKNAFTSVWLKVLVMIQASQNIENNCNIVCCQYLQYKALCVFLTLFEKRTFYTSVDTCGFGSWSTNGFDLFWFLPLVSHFSHGLEHNINVTHLSWVIFISSTLYFGVWLEESCSYVKVFVYFV